MSKKKIWVLVPLGLLLVSLVVLAGCRPSTALTDLVDALNALNPGMETTPSEEEQEEDETSRDMDPMDEERDDAKIREMDELIGQLLENMDEEEAEAAARALYENLAESHEWGAQQYNPDNLNDEHETGALALYISDHNISSESGRTTGTGITVPGTRIDSSPGVASSSGTLQSDEVTVTPDVTEEPVTTEENGGAQDSNASTPPQVDLDSKTAITEQPPEETVETEEPTGTSEPEGSGTSTGSQTSVTWDNWTGYNIIATGEVAVMVCMLGGADRLLATSESLRDNEMAQEAWGDQLHCAYLWSGDGTGEMNATEFDTLLGLLDELPEGSTTVVIEMSGVSIFSSDPQFRVLAAREDMGYYSLAHMNSTETMKSVVKNLATDMDSADGVDGTPAGDIADAYGYWVDDMVNKMSDCTTTIRETVFIEDWDKNVEMQFNVQEYVDEGNGTLPYWSPTDDYIPVTQGAAVIRVGRSFRPLTALLIDADVYDWSAAPHTRARNTKYFNSNYGYGDSFSSTINEDEWWYESSSGGNGGTLFVTQSGDYCYVTPLFDRLYGTTTYPYGSEGETDYAVQGLRFSNARDGIGIIDDSYKDKSQGVGTKVSSNGLSYGYLCLGYSDITTWDTVIVKNEDIYWNLTTNSAWKTNDQTGIYMQNPYDRNASTGTSAPDYYFTPWTLGDTSSLKNVKCYSTVGGDYKVLVNPTGLGDWTGESPEAILEMCWAMREIQNCDQYSDYDLKSDISEFYGEFYGLDYAWNGPEIAAILAQPQS